MRGRRTTCPCRTSAARWWSRGGPPEPPPHRPHTSGGRSGRAWDSRSRHLVSGRGQTRLPRTEGPHAAQRPLRLKDGPGMLRSHRSPVRRPRDASHDRLSPPVTVPSAGLDRRPRPSGGCSDGSPTATTCSTTCCRARSTGSGAAGWPARSPRHCPRGSDSRPLLRHRRPGRGAESGGSAWWPTDFCLPMLALARPKFSRDRGPPRSANADALRSPSPTRASTAPRSRSDCAMSPISIAPWPSSPGWSGRAGELAVLEFTVPACPAAPRLYLFYFRRLLPRLGGRDLERRVGLRLPARFRLGFPQRKGFFDGSRGPASSAGVSRPLRRDSLSVPRQEG